MTTIRLDPAWQGVDGVFGGHVFARLADAAVDSVEHRLASLSITFVSSVQTGDAELDLSLIHKGRRSAASRFELVQDERVRAYGIAEHTTPGEPLMWAERRELPPRPPTATAPEAGQLDLIFRDRLDVAAVDLPRRDTEGGVWVRFHEDPASVSVTSPEGALMTMLDVVPPGLFSGDDQPTFVPTLSFTAHLRTDIEVDPRAWTFVSHRTVWATRTSCIDDTTAWSTDGSLLASSRQTRAVRWAA